MNNSSLPSAQGATPGLEARVTPLDDLHGIVVEELTQEEQLLMEDLVRPGATPVTLPTSNRPSKIAGPLAVMPKEVYDSVGHRM
jgi:hypothetical protein